MDYLTKIIHNKRNNQLSIVLNRKKLQLLKKKIPKSIHIKNMELKF